MSSNPSSDPKPSATTAQITAAGLSAADQNMNNSPEDISHAATGHKANLSNPNTSEASKRRSEKALEALGGEDAFYGKEGGK